MKNPFCIAVNWKGKLIVERILLQYSASINININNIHTLNTLYIISTRVQWQVLVGDAVTWQYGALVCNCIPLGGWFGNVSTGLPELLLTPWGRICSQCTCKGLHQRAWTCSDHSLPWIGRAWRFLDPASWIPTWNVNQNIEQLRLELNLN